MTTGMRRLGAAALGLGLVLLGCPPDDPTGPELFPVDPETFPDELEAQLLDHRDAHLESTDWVEQTELWQQTGLPPVDRPADEDDEVFRRWIELLAEDVFVEDHLVDGTETELWYRLDGPRICAGIAERLDEVGPPDIEPVFPLGPVDEVADQLDVFPIVDDPEAAAGPAAAVAEGETVDFDEADCAQFVDDADIRLRVTSPDFQVYRIGVQTRPDGQTPAAVAVADDITLVDVDVEDLGATLAEARPADEAAEPIDAQDFEGRFQWIFEIGIFDQTGTTLNVLETVRARLGDRAVRLEDGQPVFERTVDEQAREIETALDIGRLDVRLPVFDRAGETAVWTVGEVSTRAQFAQAHPDEWRLFDVGAGDPPSLEFEGIEVVDVQRSRADPFDARLSVADEGLDWSVDRSVQWMVSFRFTGLVERLELQEWMAFDTWTIALEADNSPTVGLRAPLVFEAVEGRLIWESDRLDEIREVEQGECLVPVADIDEDAVHPVEWFDVGPCP